MSGVGSETGGERGGDRLSIEDLLERNLPALRAFIRLKAGPGVLQAESSSDLAQSVCREVLQDADQFQHGGADGFRRWLFTRALRKISDRYRHNFADKRTPRREVADAFENSAWLQACVSCATPSRHAVAREQLASLERAFAEDLTQDQQDIVLWSRFVGLSHAEIGSELGKSEVAVRKTLSRALAKLSVSMDA